MADSDSGPESQVNTLQADDNFGQTVVNPPENIERHEKRGSDSV